MGETVTRTFSGIVYILLLTAAIFSSSTTFLLLFGFFLATAIVEFCKLVNLKPLLPLIIGMAAYSLFSFFPSSPQTEFLLLAASLFVLIKCMLRLWETRRQPMDDTSKYVDFIGYLIIPFIILTKLPFYADRYEPKIIMSIFVLIWINDTFAFIVGKSIGQTKLFERISPKKTVEGFIGGLCFAALAGLLLARFYLNESFYIWTVIAFIVSIFGTFGDLVESKYKRDAGVKDSGTIMPGHGGILDRLDSIIFAGPFVFLFYQIVNYVS